MKRLNWKSGCDDTYIGLWLSELRWNSRGADKSLARPGSKQPRKHVRDARDFNNIETRDIKFFFLLQGKAPKEIHAILTETLAYFLPGRLKDLPAPLYCLNIRVEPQKFLLTTYRITQYQKSYDHNFQTRSNLTHYRIEKRSLWSNFPGGGAETQCASARNTDTTETQPHQISNTQRTENATNDVVIQQHSRKLLMTDILMSETCWAHKKWNKIAGDIKLVFYSTKIIVHLLVIVNHYKWFYIRLFVIFTATCFGRQLRPSSGGGTTLQKTQLRYRSLIYN